MGEGESTTPVRSLEVSISFGRFENDLLSWEKWSSFSQNKYLEEVEKCATPGSVKEKKAYFEARNKLIAVRKAEMLNKQMEASRESSTANEIQDPCRNGVNQYDEEVIEENVFGSEVSSPDVGEHPGLETNIFACQEPGEKDVIGDLTEAEIVQQEQILKNDLNGCGTNQPFGVQTLVLGSAQANEENQIGHLSDMGSKVDVCTDAPEEVKEETILKSELSPSMLYQLKAEDAWPSESPSPIEGENVRSEYTEDIPASETVNIAVEPECDREQASISDGKSAQSQRMKRNPPRSSSREVFPVNRQNGVENVKKVASSVPRSPQTSIPKKSKPSTAAVKSVSPSLPVSRVKKTAASAAPKSPHVAATTRSTSHSTTPALKSSLLSPSKKGADSLTSKKKSNLAGVSRKPTPATLHMSLNFGSKVSGSVSGSTSVTEPRKSLFMEKMGDKDIVKRAFHYMSTPLNSVSMDANATPKQVRDKTDVKPSKPTLQKHKDRLVKKGVEEISKKPSSISTSYNLLARHSKDDKRKEVKKVTEKAERKEAPKTRLPSNSKEVKEFHTGERRQSLTYKATAQPGLCRAHRLSISFQDKDASNSELRH
uniref:TPX2 C-terminal domain-containing protein n=1 Tax=Kalanchoe fedtschenkoi TaxID=63787 RepID=A0A7N0TR67_KALFE